MNWRLSKKVICLQYRSYSCGRFVSNILSYNKNFVPQFDLDNEQPITTYSNIDYKHKAILKTIPDDDNLKNWRNYELSCEKFYGVKFYEPGSYKKIFHLGSNSVNTKNLDKVLYSIKPKAKEIIEADTFFTFIVSHQNFSTRIIKEIFPNAIHIQFVNDDTVNKISKQIKSNIPNLGIKTEILDYDENLYKFDIGTLFIKSIFFDEINKLLTYLNCNDKQLDSKVDEYYEKYISLYKPYIDIK